MDNFKFNWKQYLDNYPDLRLAGIVTERGAWKHYQHFGKLENRTSCCLKTYLPESFDDFLKGPSVVISLKRSQETRGNYTLKLLQETGFENCKLFDAFDGYSDDLEIVIKERNLKYTPIHNFCRGQKGCGISHMNIWKMVLDENLDYITIFEDDALPEHNFKEFAKSWYSHTPKNIDLCYLGSIAWEHEYPQIYGKQITYNPTFCAHAYVVTKNFARKALNLIKQSCENGGIDNIDSEMKIWCDRNQISFCVWNNKGIFTSKIPLYNSEDNSQDTIHHSKNNGLIYQNAKLGSVISSAEIKY